MDSSPPPYEVLKPFLIMDYLLLHFHLLYSVSLFLPLSFYKCVLNFVFSVQLPPGSLLYLFFLLLSFGVVWIAPALCLKS